MQAKIFKVALVGAIAALAAIMVVPLQSIAQPTIHCESTDTWKGSIEKREHGLACVMRNGKKIKVFYFGVVSYVSEKPKQQS